MSEKHEIVRKHVAEQRALENADGLEGSDSDSAASGSGRRRVRSRTRSADGSRAALRPDLQGLRAIAVLVVVATDLFHWPRGGFVGVDIFFVLSGFFITGILIRERTRRRRVEFSEFYARRVKRIVPTALLVSVVTVLASYLLLPAERAKQILLDALYANVFAANFRFQTFAADCFQPRHPPSPLLHFWSLSIQQQFYVVWPVLLVLIFDATRRRRKRGSRMAGHVLLAWFLTLLVIASFGWAWHLTAANANIAYFSSLARLWELGVGALLATLGPWLVSIRDSVRPVLAYAGLAGVAVSLFVIDGHSVYPGPLAAVPVLSSALVIAAFHGSQARNLALLTNPVSRWIGDRSYALYLWHWPVILLLSSVMARGEVFYAAAIALAVGLTVLTYQFYENPIRNSTWLLDLTVARDGRLRHYKRRIWAVIGAVVLFAALAGIAAMNYQNGIIEARKGAAASADSRDEQNAALPPPFDRCHGAPTLVYPGAKPGA